MTERKRDMGSDLAKVDAHTITAEEYEEIPELTDEWFARAELHVAGKKVGRPRSATRKQAIKLRVDPDVLEVYRATGPGWQTRMNEALRTVAYKAVETPRVGNVVRLQGAAHPVAHKSAQTVSKRKTAARGAKRRAAHGVSRKAAKGVKRK